MNALSFKKTVLLATFFLMTSFIIKAELQVCTYSRYDTYQKFQCMTTSTGSQSLIMCSFYCLEQASCIGIFHDRVSLECLIINRTEKIENCSYSYPSTWRAYKKIIEIGNGECNFYLMNRFGFTYLRTDSGIDDRKGVLNYVPTSSEEVGGISLKYLNNLYILVSFDRTRKVIGVATQGRWRNDSLESCCDERLTSFRLSYWDESDWVVYKTFEANAVPDSGNEVVFNFFQTPFVTRFIYVHAVGYHLKPILRIDFIGC